MFEQRSHPRHSRHIARNLVRFNGFMFLLLLLPGIGTVQAQVLPGSKVPLGLNIDINEQALVDYFSGGGLSSVDGSSTAVTYDARGWPTSDFEVVIDNRYLFAWASGATNIDPLKYSTDISGTWKLSFTGQASLYMASGGTISGQTYTAATNTTTANVAITNPKGGVFVDLRFTQTKRTATSASGTGITNLSFIRPGYTAASHPLFTTPWLNSIIAPQWNALRFMGVLGTNAYGSSTGADKYPYLLKWTDRMPYAHGAEWTGARLGWNGIPWEWVILLANASGKDIWINIPVNASGAATTDTTSYIYQLAELLAHGNSFTRNVGLKPTINVYVEYTNEPWHDGFPQGPWNQQAALDEVAAGHSNLNYDGATDKYVLRMRRIAKRTIEIGEIFKSVFKDTTGRIRPVFNNAWVNVSWANTDPDVLKYVEDNYGPPSKYLYGLAMTSYYTAATKSSVNAVLAGEKANSDSHVPDFLTQRAITTYYGLHSLAYEAGEGETGDESISPPWGPPTDPNLATLFAASRNAGMKDVTLRDIITNWFPSGGDLYMQFAHVGRYSFYGFWGLSEDITKQNTGKWNGVLAAMATPAPALKAGIALPATLKASVSFPPVPNAYNTPIASGSASSTQGLFYLLNAPGKYKYSVVATTQGTTAAHTTMQIWLDNSPAGTVTFPTSAGNTAAVTIAVGAGLHTLRLVTPIPSTSTVTLKSITVTNFGK